MPHQQRHIGVWLISPRAQHAHRAVEGFAPVVCRLRALRGRRATKFIVLTWPKAIIIPLFGYQSFTDFRSAVQHCAPFLHLPVKWGLWNGFCSGGGSQFALVIRRLVPLLPAVAAAAVVVLMVVHNQFYGFCPHHTRTGFGEWGLRW